MPKKESDTGLLSTYFDQWDFDTHPMVSSRSITSWFSVEVEQVIPLKCRAKLSVF